MFLNVVLISRSGAVKGAPLAPATRRLGYIHSRRKRVGGGGKHALFASGAPRAAVPPPKSPSFSRRGAAKHAIVACAARRCLNAAASRGGGRQKPVESERKLRTTMLPEENRYAFREMPTMRRSIASEA